MEDNFNNAQSIARSVRTFNDTDKAQLSQAYAILALVDEVKALCARLDSIDTDLQNLDYTVGKIGESIDSIAIRHGGR